MSKARTSFDWCKVYCGRWKVTLGMRINCSITPICWRGVKRKFYLSTRCISTMRESFATSIASILKLVRSVERWRPVNILIFVHVLFLSAISPSLEHRITAPQFFTKPCDIWINANTVVKDYWKAILRAMMENHILSQSSHFGWPINRVQIFLLRYFCDFSVHSEHRAIFVQMVCVDNG